MTPFILSQILVGIAFFSDFCSFQFKKREHVLVFFIISSILISAHFFILEVYTAGFLAIISTIRFVTFYFSTHKNFLYLFVLLTIVIFMLSYENYISVISFLGTLLVTIAVFQKNDKILRLIMMSGTSCWILHNVLIFSPVAVVLEASFLVSNLIGYYRFYVKEKIIRS